MIKIAVLDDEETTLIIIRSILEQNNYSVTTYKNPLSFLEEYTIGMFDVLFSDINMPQMNGLDVVKAIRQKDQNIIIIMLTASTDLYQMVNYFKLGVSDYLIKPVASEVLLHRLNTVLDEKKKEKQLKIIEKEKELLDLENKKLVNWRNMYANKDINQTQQLIMFLTKSIFNGGGFLWLDLLADIKKEDNGGIFLDRKFYEIIVDSANNHRKAIDMLTYINNLPALNLESFHSFDFVQKSYSYVRDKIEPMIIEHSSTLSMNVNNIISGGFINIDLDIHLKVLKELSINAIKYSPENSRIYVEIYKSHNQTTNKSKEAIIVKIRNIPRSSTLSNQDILGIPYKFTGFVFDLFYTMEEDPIVHKNEEWTNGTGLYIARTLTHKMGGWIECKNVTDRRNGENTVYVEFTYIIPISDKKIENIMDKNSEDSEVVFF